MTFRAMKSEKLASDWSREMGDYSTDAQMTSLWQDEVIFQKICFVKDKNKQTFLEQINANIGPFYGLIS